MMRGLLKQELGIVGLPSGLWGEAPWEVFGDGSRVRVRVRLREIFGLGRYSG